MSKQNELRSYLIGMIVCAFIGGTAGSFENDRNDSSVPLSVLYTALGAIIAGFAVAGLVIGVSRLFGGSFSILRLIRTSTIVCFIWMLFTILSAMLS